MNKKHPHEDLDGTPYQCDCFTRGQDYDFLSMVSHINEILDGKDNGEGANNEPWATLRRRLLELVMNKKDDACSKKMI